MWDGHLEGQKNPDRLKRNIHVDRIGVHSSEVKIAFIIARKEIMEQFCLELSGCSLLCSAK